MVLVEVALLFVDALVIVGVDAEFDALMKQLSLKLVIDLLVVMYLSMHR